MYGFMYRLLMRLAHRFNWHYAPPIYPEGDTQLWCKWCGFRQTIRKANGAELGRIAGGQDSHPLNAAAETLWDMAVNDRSDGVSVLMDQDGKSYLLSYWPEEKFKRLISEDEMQRAWDGAIQLMRDKGVDVEAFLKHAAENLKGNLK